MEAMVHKVMDNKAMEGTDNKVTEVMDNKVMEATDNKVMAVNLILMVLLNLMVAAILMVHPCPHLMVDMDTLQNLIRLLHQPTEDMENHQNLTCLVLPHLMVTRDPHMDNRWAIPDHPMDKKDTIKEATKAQQMTISTLKVELVTSNLL